MRLINMHTFPGRPVKIIKGTLHACVNSCGVVNVIIFLAQRYFSAFVHIHF